MKQTYIPFEAFASHIV